MKAAGLAQRAEQRRRSRPSTANLIPGPPGPRKQALAYLSRLPTKTLVAVHKAAVQFHEQQNQ